MSARTFRVVLLVICVLYAAQGLHYARMLIPVHDAVMYLFIGAKAVRGEVSLYDDRLVGHRPPLPFYVLGLTQVRGPNLLAARWLNVGLGVLVVLMTAALARRLGGNGAGALAAAFLATQGVVVAYYSYEGYPATAAFCFMLTCLLLFVGGQVAVVAGMAAAGALFFVRSNVWPAIPVLLAYGLWRARGVRERLLGLVLALLPPLVFFMWDSRHLKILANVPVARRWVEPLGYVSPLVLDDRQTLPLESQLWEAARLVRRYEFWVLAVVVLIGLAIWQYGPRRVARGLVARPHITILTLLFVYMLLAQFVVFSWNWRWVGLYFLPVAPLVAMILGLGFAALIERARPGRPRVVLAVILVVLLAPPVYWARNPLLPIGEAAAADPFGAAHRAGEHLRRLVPADARVFFYGLNAIYYLSGLPATYLQQVYLPDPFAHIAAEDWVLRRSGFVPLSDMRRWLSTEADYAVIDRSMIEPRAQNPGPEREMQALLDQHFELIGTVDEFVYTPYLVYRRRAARNA